MLNYQISPSNPENHLFSITLEFPSEQGKTYNLSLPAWLPGSYMIRDFAKHIHQISAFNSQQQEIALAKIDKQSWQLTATDEK